MLTFIRRIIFSRFGIIITLGVVAAIAISFAAGDITGNRQGGGSLLGGEVATVGGASVGEADLRQRAATALDAYRQQQPTMDMSAFINTGGLTVVLDRVINGLALQEFGEAMGMTISKRAVDGEIASIPAFVGPDGKFSQQQYDSILRQQRISDKQLREDIARDSLARQLIAPTFGAAQLPAQMALPYASLLLEKRQGTIGIIPVTAVDFGAPPPEAELNQYYARNRNRYLVGERRVARYAVIRASDLAAGAKPSEAEIAAAYKGAGARFAATEKRTVTQVVIDDQASAARLAQQVKGGTAIAAAARAAGLEPLTFTGLQKAALASQTAPAVADAAFGAAEGSVIGPVRSPLGWHVARVDKVETVAARGLDQVRGELTAELEKAKLTAALTAIHDKIDDAIGEGATFDEIAADNKLKAEQTVPLLTGGRNADSPDQAPDPLLARVADGAFAGEPGDSPQIVQVAPDGSFAVVGTARVVASAPRPLDQIRAQVLRDFAIERALRTARGVAMKVIDKVSKGMPMQQAMTESGLKLPAVKPVDASRAQLAAANAQLPPPVAMMFSMKPRTAKLLEAPNRGGWYVVSLAAIQEGQAKGNQPLIQQTRAGLGSVIGRELTEQFTAAVRKHVGVTRNEKALAKVRSDLTGGAGTTGAQ